MCLGASNVSFGLPQRHVLERRLPADGDGRRPDERDHVDRRGLRRGGAGVRPAARPRRVGRELDRRPPRAPGRAAQQEAAQPYERGGAQTTHARARGAGRTRRRRAARPAAVPARRRRGPRPERARRSSTPRAGTGSRSTRPAAATAPARSARCGSCPGEVPVGTVDPRAFTTDELRDGWRLACRAGARGDLVVEVPPLQTRPKAALVGVGRHVILRPSVQKRHLVLERADARGPAAPTSSACSTRSTTSSPTHRSSCCARSAARCASRDFDVTAVVCDEELIDVEPGDTTARRFAIAFDLGTTTVVATLLDLDSGQPRRGRARCSTASSPTAPT